MMRRNTLTAVTGVGVLSTLAAIVSPSLAAAATGRAVGHPDYASHLKPTFRPDNAQPSVLVTSLGNTGAGTLRAAVENAKAGDVIGFASTVTGTIHLTAAITISQPLYIEGPGAADLDVDGGSHSNDFQFSGNGRSTISGLTISGGKAEHSDANGGGVDLQSGSLTLDKVVVTSNQATYAGGGISVESAATGLDIYDSTISNNSAAKSGGGIFIDLAGPNSSGAELTVQRSTISGNTAGTQGGGIYADSCPPGGIQLSPGTDPADCQFPARYAQTDPVAHCPYGTVSGSDCDYVVYYASPTDPYCDYGILGGTSGHYTCTGPAYFSYTTGPATCPTGTTLNGVYCYGAATGYSSDATIDTSTISGNTAASAGGGLFLRSMAGQAEVLRSTIAGNAGGGIDDSSPAGSPLLVADLISNTGADCAQPATTPKLKDDGYNVVTDASCALTDSTSHASASTSAIALGALAGNGGSTQTIAVGRSTSDPAYLSIPASAVLPGTTTPICSGTDQRGVDRSGSCDVGAFNSEPAPTIRATLSSSTAKTKYGWYRSNVTVSFACASGAAGIVSVTCPPAKVDSKQGKSVSVAGTAVAQDGATATATAKVNLDKTKPTVIGVKSGKSYSKAPKIKCHDSLSGVASCKVSKSKPSSKHVVKYSVTATDKAGNVRKVKGSYKLKK